MVGSTAHNCKRNIFYLDIRSIYLRIKFLHVQNTVHCHWHNAPLFFQLFLAFLFYSQLNQVKRSGVANKLMNSLNMEKWFRLLIQYFHS